MSSLEDKISKILVLIRDKRFEIKEIISFRSNNKSLTNIETVVLTTKQSTLKTQLTVLLEAKEALTKQLKHQNELLGIIDPNTICGCCVNLSGFDLDSLCIETTSEK